MYCTQDCTCSLCRELRGLKPKLLGKAKKDAHKTCNDNFILRRRMSDFDDYNNDDNDHNNNNNDEEGDPPASSKLQTPSISCSKASNSGPVNVLNKASSCNELRQCMDPPKRPENIVKKIDQHKVIIYFGDSISNKRSVAVQQLRASSNDVNASVSPSASNVRVTVNPRKAPPPPTKLATAAPKSDFIRQLKTVLDQKNRNATTITQPAPVSTVVVATPSPQPILAPAKPSPSKPMRCDKAVGTRAIDDTRSLPDFVDSIVDGVINIKIEDNFERASDLVKAIAAVDKTSDDELYVSTDDLFDWSFVQDWRSRPSGNSTRNDLAQYNPSNATASAQHPATRSGASNHHNPISPPNISPGSPLVASSSSMTSSGRIQSPAVATPAPRISKEVAFRPSDQQQRHLATTQPPPLPTIKHHNVPANHFTDDISSGNHVPVSGYGHDSMHPATRNNTTTTSTPATMIPERDTGPIVKMTPPNCKPIPHRPMSGPAKLTIQSIPVKSQPPMLSSGLGNIHKTPPTAKSMPPILPISSASNTHQDHVKSSAAADQPKLMTSPVYTTQPQPAQLSQKMPFHGGAASHAQKPTTGMRTHHHGGTHEFRGLHRVNECHSSSDENRSSGHASMSDTGHGSSSPGGNRSNEHLGPLPEDRLAAGVTNRSARSRASTGHSRPRNRGAPTTKVPWGGGGLEDIKLAIQQLTMRSQTSTSTYSSLSAGSESSEPARRLGRYSSLETVNTNVTSADEFVWVDSHNRLVELQHPPWSQHCVLRVIRGGRCRENSERISTEAVPRLGYLLQRALVRVAREIQRLSGGLGLCSKHEVAGAFKIVLCPALADSCIKACLRAAAMFAVPGDSALRQSKSSRAGLQLPVGRFHRWMADARLGKFVHEYAAVYLSAGLENLLEEILLQCLPTDVALPLTATGLEHAIAGSGDLWGLLQPYAHLNAGRIASGALTMPRWASQSSIGSHSAAHTQPAVNPAMEPCLLTTCVGSIGELKDLVFRAQNKFHHTALSHAALIALFYFMRCSQLEHSDGSGSVGGVGGGVGGGGAGGGASGSGGNGSIQELCYERAYVVLPPLVEWLRVATAHAEYRHSILIDKDDIMQSARLLLPGVDCPPRLVSTEEELPSKKTQLQCVVSAAAQQHHSTPIAPGPTTVSDDINEYGRRATLALSFRLMMSGRPELLMQAASLLPPTTRYDTLNPLGMTALMVAVIRNDEQAIQMLLDVGADPNVEVPAIGSHACPAIHPETQQWTAITFAACRGNYQTVRMLLERGGHVEGGARLSEDKCTLTPLQVASGSGCLDVVSLLLAHGAHAFLSTQQKDSMCFAGSAQRGCYSAISVAAAHGQRTSLRKLLSHPLAPGSREVLSLEEMLAEGDSSTRSGAVDRQNEAPPTLNKTQIKCLQEAMYHSAENNHLDITVELRALGVPWTLHCWMHALAAAHELRLDAVIDQLLQDFLQVCPDDYSSQFVSECLPLLFNIFRYSKKEGTTLLLADIFATCFGWDAIKMIKEPVLQPVNGSRIDPKFVNNPELSDVMFRVEGKIFYGHKIVLVTASPRFQSMLSPKLSEGTTPTVQINDIRYHIFQLVMQFLYSGGCNALEVVPGDVLELMAAASFFQLDSLLRYTEARCAQMIDIDNVVAMYIHAKVYNAPKLMEYCQGFLLQNMVALLTYDDSVKRLLFAKKIPNHDVLGGLLGTLQARIKVRRSASNPSNVTGRPVVAAMAATNKQQTK